MPSLQDELARHGLEGALPPPPVTLRKPPATAMEMVRSLKSVKGQRLTTWLTRFLTASPEQLASWSGNFTEVTTAKVVEIYRRRGVIDEHEAQQARFGELVNACYRLPVYKPAGDTIDAKGELAIANPS